MKNVYFISGIDTDIGKSYAAGYIAKEWTAKGLSVITQKLVQTGNEKYSEDILLHRKIMGIDLLQDDIDFFTMPEVFSYPASPHLAAQIDKREINFEKIDLATRKLSKKYDKVILEGAGGLMVPLTEDFFTIDYIKKKNYPLIFVTSGKLGSINHTILSLEAIKKRKIKLNTIVYNLATPNTDELIEKSTLEFFKKYLAKYFSKTELMLLPKIEIK